METPALTPKHRDLIYDVGLHKGEDSEFYLRKGFRVVAFEADPDLIAFCRGKFKKYLDRGQLKIVEGAIVDPAWIRAGQKKVRFYKNSSDSTWGTVCNNWAERNEGLGTSSTVLDLDAIDFVQAIREHGVPYFMKVDIEGCDLVCIRALREFAKRPTYISIESDKTSFEKIREEIDLLCQLGYASFQAVEQSAIPARQSPPRPPKEGKYVFHNFAWGASGLFGAELDGSWKSRREILHQYRLIRLGYLFLGDAGIMSRWSFRGACRLQSWAARIVGSFTHAAVPGWYDTHARLSVAETE